MGCSHAGACCCCGGAVKRCLGHDPWELAGGRELAPSSLGHGADSLSDGGGDGPEAEALLQGDTPSRSSSDLGPEGEATAEQILARGALLHRYHLEAWDSALHEGVPADHCPGSRDDGAFEDPDGLLGLSATQEKELQSWLRFEKVRRAADVDDPPAVFEGPPLSSSIKQGMVMDCSLISALSVMADYERRFGLPVLRSTVFPSKDGEPVYNPRGWYGCRLFVNGIPRAVEVDDRVPAGRGGRLLCAHSARGCELWVSLLEKAMAKVGGGSYEMEGSNPGTDAFHLTGWLPESLPLGRQSREELDQSYDAFLEGWRAGDCVVCVGTTRLADAVGHEEARRRGYTEGVSPSTGLVANHAYPVLDLRSVRGTRLLLLKNPWGRVRWRGRWCPGDRSWQADAAAQEAVGDALTTVAGQDDGLFWIEWHDVARYFSHLYLCWAPHRLALHRLEAHGRWDARPHFAESALRDDADLLAFDPQYLLRLEQGLPRAACAGGADLWVLLSTHVRRRRDVRARYRAVSVYTGSGRLLSPPDGLIQQGVFSNSECVPLKLHGGEAEGATELVLVVSQHASKAPFNFTLQVYSPVPAALEPLPPVVPEGSWSGAVRGHWSPRTAGGCTNKLWSFFRNPQWRFEVPPGGLEALVLFLECPLALTVNVRVFRGAVASPEDLDGAASSGMYRRSCGVLRLEGLLPGPHVAVVSAFKPGACGEYRLSWHSLPQAVELHPQPHPFAESPPHPLCSAVHEVSLCSRRLGQHARLRLDLRDPGAGGARLSVRVQTDTRAEEVPPEMSLRRVVDGDGDPREVECELLDPDHADSHFTETGASVILLARLPPGESHVLEVWAEREAGPSWGRGKARAMICSDRPLLVSNLTGGTASGWS